MLTVVVADTLLRTFTVSSLITTGPKISRCSLVIVMYIYMIPK